MKTKHDTDRNERQKRRATPSTPIHSIGSSPIVEGTFHDACSRETNNNSNDAVSNLFRNRNTGR